MLSGIQHEGIAFIFEKNRVICKSHLLIESSTYHHDFMIADWLKDPDVQFIAYSKVKLLPPILTSLSVEVFNADFTLSIANSVNHVHFVLQSAHAMPIAALVHLWQVIPGISVYAIPFN